MHPNAFQYLTSHARERIRQRTNVDPELVESAVRGNRAISIGKNPEDSETDLLVFYNLMSDIHYILVQSRKTKLILTVLFPDSARWQVDDAVISKAKHSMEELNMIRQVKQKWGQERKPSQPASPDQLQTLASTKIVKS